MTDNVLLIRNVTIGDKADVDVRIENGRIAEIGRRLAGHPHTIDGRGGVMLPGLVDHHCHLFASAAQAASVLLDEASDMDDIAQKVRRATIRPRGLWIRATGCPAALAEHIDRDLLDIWAPDHPIRIQDQGGRLWILNSTALAIMPAVALPPCVERDLQGNPTGRVWRGDHWLGAAIGLSPPPFAPLGRKLAALGITAVTDASASNTQISADLLVEAHDKGELPQRLTVMSSGPLASDSQGRFAIGPVKILLDDRDLLTLDAFIEKIGTARAWRRAVAVHCVTAAELALTLAAFEAAGAALGDRIEHGSVVPAEAIPTIVKLGLAVVTQPIFLRDRGDRYLDEVDPADQQDLYRCASLLAAGIPVAASSDAPYGDWNCWAAMRAATNRLSGTGRPIVREERVTSAQALSLFLGVADNPGGPPRRIIPGAPADLCLIDGDPEDFEDDRVLLTVIDGKVVHQK